MSGTYHELLKNGFEVDEIKANEKEDNDDDSTQVENKLMQKRCSSSLICTETSFPV